MSVDSGTFKGEWPSSTWYSCMTLWTTTNLTHLFFLPVTEICCCGIFPSDFFAFPKFVQFHTQTNLFQETGGESTQVGGCGHQVDGRRDAWTAVNGNVPEVHLKWRNPHLPCFYAVWIRLSDKGVFPPLALESVQFFSSLRYLKCFGEGGLIWIESPPSFVPKIVTPKVCLENTSTLRYRGHVILVLMRHFFQDGFGLVWFVIENAWTWLKHFYTTVGNCPGSGKLAVCSFFLERPDKKW